MFFPDPFDDEYSRKRAAPAPARPTRTSSKQDSQGPPQPFVELDASMMSQWDDIESSLGDAPPAVSPSPAAMGQATPPRPPRPQVVPQLPVQPQAAQTPTAAPRASAAGAKKPEPSDKELTAEEKQKAEEHFKELELLLSSISTDDLDSF